MSMITGKARYNWGYERLMNTTLSFQKILAEKSIFYIKNRIGDRQSAMRHLSNAFLQLASRELFMEKNIKKQKEYSFIGAKLRILSRENFNGAILSTIELFDILISNNKDFVTFIKNHLDRIIPNDFDEKHQKYVTLTNSKIQKFVLRTTLVAIVGNFKELKRRCETYDKECKETKYYGNKFFLALVNNDKEKMKKIIEDMMNPEVARNIL